MVIGSRLCLLVAGVTLAGGSAFAQALATPDTKPNLSKQLNQSNGVIHPKEVDPAIEKPAPKVGDPNVVPPPETSGARERRSQNERPETGPDVADIVCILIDERPKSKANTMPCRHRSGPGFFD